ncbi:MAG: TadE/TadG family type IV pilus assembly protein [Bacilli bacterium]
MNRKGQALVEFVLILPIFILILFAVVDFGMILSKKSELENISVDIVSMIKNGNNIDDIRDVYSSISIDINQDSKYTTISISEDVDIITPGLNLVFGDPYKVMVERTMPNVKTE